MTLSIFRPRAPWPSLSWSLPVPARLAWAWLRTQAEQRSSRPWLGIVGIAIAVSAVLLTSVGVLLPLLVVCAWWWCPRERFVWLLPLGAGLITVAWVTVGAGLMAILPRPSADLLWMASAAWFGDLAVLVRILAERRHR